MKPIARYATTEVLLAAVFAIFGSPVDAGEILLQERFLTEGPEGWKEFLARLSIHATRWPRWLGVA